MGRLARGLVLAGLAVLLAGCGTLPRTPVPPERTPVASMLPLSVVALSGPTAPRMSIEPLSLSIVSAPRMSTTSTRSSSTSMSRSTSAGTSIR